MGKIFLIDDDEVFNLLSKIQINLVVPDAEVVEFTSALAALEFLNSNSSAGRDLPRFIFLDVRMPEMDGFGFLDAIESSITLSALNIPIIMLTSSLHPADRKRAQSYKSILEYWEKPLSIKDFEKIKDRL